MNDIDQEFDVVITTNSPGEVAAWVNPVVAELGRRAPAARISVFMPPCRYASGAEKSVVLQMPGIASAAGPGEYLRYLLLGRIPAGFRPGKRGVVLFLGSDLMHAVFLSRRLGFPAVAYTEGFVNWRGSFARFLVPYPSTRERLIARGTPPEKVRVVGNLMLDAVGARLSGAQREALLGWTRPGPVVALFFGSRPFEIAFMAPFLLRAAELIAREAPEARFVSSISPFVSVEQLKSALAGPAPGRTNPGKAIPGGVTLEVEGSGGSVLEAAGADLPGLLSIESAGGVKITALRGFQYDIMEMADLALTIPGTNTAELAFLGVPMVVAFPLNKPEEIPLEGLAGMAGNLPAVGPVLKRALIQKLDKRIRFTAQPNMIAREEIVPEIRGVLQPLDVALPAIQLLRDPARREAISARLREVIGGRGAAGRVVAETLAVISSYNV
ncbi:MAG: hypothetical protein M1379_16330 [Firmicutes bacterium]|nr:hypothetical protein [Bacillota bacterium]